MCFAAVFLILHTFNAILMKSKQIAIDNPIQGHLKAMILAGRGEIFNDNPIQSDLKAMIVAGRGSVFNDNPMIILSGAF